MVVGIDQHDRDAVEASTFQRHVSDRDGEPFARALAAAAVVASAVDLQQAGSTLAREMCRLAGADECRVHVQRAGGTAPLCRYLARGSAAEELAARCEVAGQTVTLPLAYADEKLGSLDLCWQTSSADAGRITPEVVALRDLAAAHLWATLERDDHRRRLRALDDLASDMRRQLHEHANRMQVLSGLHELGDDVAAHRFLAEMVGGYEGSPSVRVGRIHDPVVAGTLVALMRDAERREVLLELEASSRLERVPSTLNVLDLVTVVANCITNALDAAATQAGDRRRVHVKIKASHDVLILSVRDWGPGVQGRTLDDLCHPGSTTKPGHHGVGLTLVREIVETQGGSIDLEASADGVKILVALPWT